MRSLVIFDLDGTLMDTIDDIAFSMNVILEKHGFPTHDREAYKYFVGSGARLLAERALPESERSEAAVSAILSEFTPFYELHKQDRTCVYEGMHEALERLRAMGVRLAVASNKPHELVPGILQYYFPQHPFSLFFGHRKGHPIKPDPEIVHDILSRLQATREETLYVGDTAVDMQTAHAAGLEAAGALWGFRTRKELLEAHADYLLEHPSELVELVKNC